MPGARRRKRPASSASASASKATKNNSGNDGDNDNGVNAGRFKIITVPPSSASKRLGLTIEFSTRYSGALVRGVDPQVCDFADQINVGDRVVTNDGRQVNKAEDLRNGNEGEGGGERTFGIVPAGSAALPKARGMEEIDSFLIGRGCPESKSAKVAASSNEATEGEGSIGGDLSSFCASMKSYMVSQVGMRLDHLKGTRGADKRREELLEKASEDFPFLKGVNWTVERRERLKRGDAGDGFEGADVDDGNDADEIKFKSNDEGAADVSLTVDEIRAAATEISGRRTRAAKRTAGKETASAKKGSKRKRSSPKNTAHHDGQSDRERGESFFATDDNGVDDDSDASGDAGRDDTNAHNLKPPAKKRSRIRSNPKKPGIVSFDQRLQQCKFYKETNGHLNIPSHYKSDEFDRDAVDYKLGLWAEEMRENYRRYFDGEFDDKGASRGSNKGGKHTVGYRLEVLEEMGFNFELRGQDGAEDGAVEGGGSGNDGSTRVWDYKIERCREFKAENGHLNIPIGDKCLGHFADRMRSLYRRRLESGSKKSSAEKLTSIEREKVQFLESMGFAFDGVFDVNLQRLEAFKAENGHTRVPIKYLPDRALGCWAEMVRREHNRTNRGEASDYLTADRLRKLATAGFTFSTRKETPWEVRFERLREYHAEHGRDPPISHPEMGNWVQTQRFYYCQRREGKLRVKDETWDEREEKLRGIGFVFQVGKRMSSEGKERMRAGRKISWDERLADFVAWKERHGHPYVPTVTEGEDKHLGRWVAAQRMAYKAYRGESRSKKYGVLTAERALKLANAGFAFDAKHIQRTPKAGVAAAGARAEEEGHRELEEPRDGHYHAEEEAETDWGAY